MGRHLTKKELALVLELAISRGMDLAEGWEITMGKSVGDNVIVYYNKLGEKCSWRAYQALGSCSLHSSYDDSPHDCGSKKVDYVAEVKFTVKSGGDLGVINCDILTPDEVRRSSQKKYYYRAFEEFEPGDLVVVKCATGLRACQVSAMVGVPEAIEVDSDKYVAGKVDLTALRLEEKLQTTRAQKEKKRKRFEELRHWKATCTRSFTNETILEALAKTDPGIAGKLHEFKLLEEEHEKGKW